MTSTQGASDDDSDLQRILGAIGEEVHLRAEAARAGLAAEYAGKLLYARKHLPQAQIAGAVRAILEARSAALALIARLASAEASTRRRVAIDAHREKKKALRPRPPRHAQKPQGPDR